MTASRKLISLLRGGDLGFIAVVIVAYISATATAGYAPRAFTPFRLALLIAAGLSVRLVIEDDGIGGGNANAGGFGLLGVRERAQLLGGHVRVRASAGHGFALEVELPASSPSL